MPRTEHLQVPVFAREFFECTTHVYVREQVAGASKLLAPPDTCQNDNELCTINLVALPVILDVLQAVFRADETVDPMLAPVRSVSGTDALPLDELRRQWI